MVLLRLFDYQGALTVRYHRLRSFYRHRLFAAYLLFLFCQSIFFILSIYIYKIYCFSKFNIYVYYPGATRLSLFLVVTGLLYGLSSENYVSG